MQPGSVTWVQVLFFHAFKNFKMAETDVLEVEVDDRADFTEDTGEGTLYDRQIDGILLQC